MIEKIFSPSMLNWNIHTKAVWLKDKQYFIDRMKNLIWADSVNGKIELPAQVAYLVDTFTKATTNIRKVLRVGHEAEFNGINCLFALECSHNDGTSTLYIHYNGKVSYMLANTFVKKLTIVKHLNNNKIV